MPNTIYETSLKIGGAIDAKLTSGLQNLAKNILGITANTKNLHKHSKESFFAMKEGAEGAKKSVEGLKEVVSELLVPILGVTAAFSSIKSIFGTLDTATEKFKDAREEAAQLRSVIAGSDFIGRHPGALDAQVARFEEQQELSKKANQGLWGGRIFEAEQTELAVRAGLGTGLTDSLVAAIPTVVAKMQGGIGKVTIDSVRETTDAIALAIKTGRAKGPIFGFDAAQIKAFRAMDMAHRITMIMQAANFKGGAAYLAQQKASNPDQFRLIGLQTENATKTKQLGADWIGVTDQIAVMSEETKGIFTDVLDDLIKPMTPYIRQALGALEIGIKNTGSWVEWLFKNPSQITDKLKTALNNALDGFKKYCQDNNLGWLAGDVIKLQKMDWGKEWASELKTLQDIGKTFADIGQLLADISDGKMGNLGADIKALQGDLKDTFTPADLAQRQKEEASMGNAPTPGRIMGATGELPDFGKQSTWIPKGSILDKLLGETGKETDQFQKNTAAAEEEAKKRTEHTEKIKVGTEAAKALGQQLLALDVAMLKQLQMITKVTGNDLFHFNLALDDATTKLLQLSVSAAAGGIGGAGAGGGGGGFGAGAAQGAGGAVRVEGYGPAYGETGQVTGNHGNKLVMGDYAVSPDLTSGHSPGQQFSFMAGGQQHVGTYNDTSMRAPGQPNHGVIEGWNQPDLGRVSGIQWMKEGGQVRKDTLAFLHGGENVIAAGKSGPAKSSGAHFSRTNHFNLTMNVSGHGGEDFATEVASLVQEKFSEIQSTAYEHFLRTNLS
jgi:hypothetical protein